MLYASGRRYEGYWQDDLRHKRGYERYANHNTYIGEFSKGKANGHGVYRWWSTGEVYDGQWEKGIRQGKGFFKG